MSALSSLRRRSSSAAVSLAAASALVLGLTACSGDDAAPAQNEQADTDGSGEVSPEEVLAFAKTRLDETTGVRLTLATDDTPAADAFLSEADGVVIADPPAFEGTASGSFAGLPASDVRIVSVDGTVHADLLGGFREFELPRCVPDPAGLLDPASGFATVLTEATDVTAGESVRGGADNDQVLTPYTATVPRDAVRNLLPCAPGQEFDATFDVAEDGSLSAAEITGEFFEGAEAVTYRITVAEYDVQQEITTP